VWRMLTLAWSVCVELMALAVHRHTAVVGVWRMTFDECLSGLDEVVCH